jgi:hypothetical protein
MMRFIILILLSTSLLTSCDPIAIDADFPEVSKLCVNSCLTDNSSFLVEITWVKPFLNNSNEFAFVCDARVELFEDDRPVTIVTPFFHRSSPEVCVYRIDEPSFQPQAGSRYQLKITYTGFPDIVAETRFPSNVPILKVDTLPGNNTESSIPINVYFYDEPGVENYYTLIERRRQYYYDSSGKVVSRYQDLPLMTSNSLYYQNIGASLDLLDGLRQEPILFSDTGIEGGLFVVPTSVLLSADTSRRDIVLRNLSEEYYRYLTSYRVQQSLSGDEFAQPVPVFSNIHNGIGIFGSYNQSVIRIK